jgi:hypothetical protein
MKKVLLAIAAFAWAGAASAGDYHIGRTLRCSQCHTMHASRAHGFNQLALETGHLSVTTGAPNPNLLIQAGTNATCLACHNDASKAPDVLALDPVGFVPAEQGKRSAGALNGFDGVAAADGYQDWMGHTIGSGDLPPGVTSGFTANLDEGFNCAQCHKVHGSDAFRNLGVQDPAKQLLFPSYNARANYGGGPRASVAFNGANDVTIGVDARTYDTQNVKFGVGTGGMNKYCAACHGMFHESANTLAPSGTDFIRHPTSGVTRIGSGELATNAQLEVVRPAWAATVGSGNFEAACLSCHKGHGNMRGYGLIYPDPAVGTIDYENGSSTVPVGDNQYPLRNLCSTCHVEGQEAGAL